MAIASRQLVAEGRGDGPGIESFAMAASPSSIARPSAATVDELARTALEHQLGELSGLAGNAATLVGLVGLLLGLLFTSDYITKHWNILLSIGVGLLGFSVLFLVATMWPNRVAQPPNPLLLVRVTHISAEEMHQVIASATASAIVQNQGLLRVKRASLAGATTVVIAGLVIIAARLIYALN